MKIPLLIILALLPVAFFVFLIIRADKYERENYQPLLISFALGVAVITPAIWIQNRIADAHWFDLRSPAQLLAFAFIGIALVEELCKAVLFFIYPYRQRFFNEPFDGVVYAVMISMGFAAVENVIYVLEFGVETGIARALTAVPAHATFGVISGYYFGRSKFEPTRKWPLIAIGLLIVLLFHTLYDFLILQEISQYLMICASISIYILSILCFFMVRNLLYYSPFKQDIS